MSKTRSKWSMSLGPMTIKARGAFTSSKLPSKREVLERMIWFMVPRPKGSLITTTKSKESAAMQVTDELCEHWVWSNVYPKHPKNVEKQVMSLYEEFKNLQKYPQAKMTEKWIKEKLEPFINKLEQGLDIRTTDISFRKRQEEWFGVKETQIEEDFWKDQMYGDRVGHCDSFVDRKWVAQDMRRKSDLKSFLRRLEKSEQEMKILAEKVEVPDEFDENLNILEDKDPDYEEDAKVGDLDESSKKRKRRSYVAEASTENSEQHPDCYRHIRSSAKKVRPEYYTAVDRCISELHMSKEQAIGSTMIIAKELFNVRWKRLEDGSTAIDMDTVPDKKNIREMGRAREALALCSLVEKIMASEDKTTIV